MAKCAVGPSKYMSGNSPPLEFVYESNFYFIIFTGCVLGGTERKDH